MAAFEAVLSLRWISQTHARGEAKISRPPLVPFFAALMRMPSASGLLHRAIIQSGALAPYDSIDYDDALLAYHGAEIRPANGEWVELCGLIAGYR